MYCLGHGQSPIVGAALTNSMLTSAVLLFLVVVAQFTFSLGGDAALILHRGVLIAMSVLKTLRSIEPLDTR